MATMEESSPTLLSSSTSPNKKRRLHNDAAASLDLTSVVPQLVESGFLDTKSLFKFVFMTSRTIRAAACLSNDGGQEAVWRALGKAHWGTVGCLQDRMDATSWTAEEAFGAYFGKHFLEGPWAQPLPLKYTPSDYVLSLEFRQTEEVERHNFVNGNVLVSLEIPGTKIPSFFEKGELQHDLKTEDFVPIHLQKEAYCWSGKAALLLKAENHSIPLMKRFVERDHFNVGAISSNATDVVESCNTSIEEWEPANLFGRYGYAGWLRRQVGIPAGENVFEESLHGSLGLDYRFNHDNNNNNKHAPLVICGVSLNYMYGDELAACGQKGPRITFAHLLEATLPQLFQTPPSEPPPLKYSSKDYVLMVDIRQAHGTRGEGHLYDCGKSLLSLALSGDSLSTFLKNSTLEWDLDKEVVAAAPCCVSKVSLYIKPTKRLVNLITGCWQKGYEESNDLQFFIGESDLPFTGGYAGWLLGELGGRFDFDPWDCLWMNFNVNYRPRIEGEDGLGIASMTGFWLQYDDISEGLKETQAQLTFAHLLEALLQSHDE